MKLSLMRDESHISKLKELLMNVEIFLNKYLWFLIHDAICVKILKEFRVNNLRLLIEFKANRSIWAIGSGS